jgi:hypothetical protein
MPSTPDLTQGFGPSNESTSFSMTLDHWLVVGPVAAALAMAAMLIWLGG